jgi:alpha-tubulin suppressor-like RCC1 family protein
MSTRSGCSHQVVANNNGNLMNWGLARSICRNVHVETGNMKHAMNLEKEA